MAFRFQEVSGNSFAVSKELPNSSCGFITFLISSCYYTLLSYHKTAGKGTAPLPFTMETPRSHSQRKNSLAKLAEKAALRRMCRGFGGTGLDGGRQIYSRNARRKSGPRARWERLPSEAPLQRRTGSFIMNIWAKRKLENPGDGREEEE